ncbi:hypothetical protein AGMMS50233_06910 [Endomicrobiia bacterium]|nr:hypothetical protein AGMMS50233_06910 [Endomicrobiia bacterium]
MKTKKKKVNYKKKLTISTGSSKNSPANTDDAHAAITATVAKIAQILADKAKEEADRRRKLKRAVQVDKVRA